jgi:hypothetical protein
LAFSYWFDKSWFLTEGILAAVLITPSLGVPNWSVIYINTAQQSETWQFFLTGRAGRAVKQVQQPACAVRRDGPSPAFSLINVRLYSATFGKTAR